MADASRRRRPILMPGLARSKARSAVCSIFRASLLPGVVVVPAMVIAIEKSQAAGIRYNRP